MEEEGVMSFHDDELTVTGSVEEEVMGSYDDESRSLKQRGKE